MADAFSLGRTSKEDLIQAFKNAQAANDTKAAENIAKAITNTSAPWNDSTRHNPNQQGSFGYGVDRAQQMFYKGVDSFGKLAGFEGVRDWSEAGYQQQVKDIEEGNYQPKYRKSLRDTYDEQGLGGGLGWLAEKSVENAASGGAALIGGGAATLAAFFSTPLAAILAGGTLVGSTLLNAGETVMEIQDGGTEDYNAALTSGVGTVNGLLDMFGASKVFKSTGVSKLATQEIIEKLIKEGKEDAAEAVFKQFLKSQGMGAAVKTGVKKTVSEATTEMFQEENIVAAGALSGNEYTGDDLVDRALESFLLGGTNAAAITTAIDIAPAPLKKYFNPKTKEMFLNVLRMLLRTGNMSF